MCVSVVDVLLARSHVAVVDLAVDFVDFWHTILMLHDVLWLLLLLLAIHRFEARLFLLGFKVGRVLLMRTVRLHTLWLLKAEQIFEVDIS